MVYQEFYDFSKNHPFQADQQMGKVIVQEKIFPNKLLQMPTRMRDKNIVYIINYICAYILHN